MTASVQAGLRHALSRRADGPPAPAPGRAGRGDPAAWLIAFVTFAAYTTISVSRYLRLAPGTWDLGIYTEYVSRFAHLQAPVVPIKGHGFNLLGDHFTPIVALIAPFFRLFPTPVTLLVAQALLTAISVVPVCRAARDRLGTGASRAIGAAYGLSWGLQQMINFDFHEIAFAVPLLAFSLSALVCGRLRGAVLWALPLVLVKEDQGFTVAAIGLIVLGGALGLPAHGLRCRADPAGRRRTWAWAGAFLLAWGLAWSAAEILVIIPHFNAAHTYPYWHDGGVVGPGGGHASAGALPSQFTHARPEKRPTPALPLLPVAFLAPRILDHHAGLGPEQFPRQVERGGADIGEERGRHHPVMLVAHRQARPPVIVQQVQVGGVGVEVVLDGDPCLVDDLLQPQVLADARPRLAGHLARPGSLRLILTHLPGHSVELPGQLPQVSRPRHLRPRRQVTPAKPPHRLTQAAHRHGHAAHDDHRWRRPQHHHCHRSQTPRQAGSGRPLSTRDITHDRRSGKEHHEHDEDLPRRRTTNPQLPPALLSRPRTTPGQPPSRPAFPSR